MLRARSQVSGTGEKVGMKHPSDFNFAFPEVGVS